MYLQTGDVLYKRVKSMPAEAKALKGNLIHQGRDHHHLIEGDFELFDHAGSMFIKANGECALTHPEHKTIALPEGLYEKGIVLEYDHWTEESRQVID